jgi:hypothetical protein
MSILQQLTFRILYLKQLNYHSNLSLPNSKSIHTIRKNGMIKSFARRMSANPFNINIRNNYFKHYREFKKKSKKKEI